MARALNLYEVRKNFLNSAKQAYINSALYDSIVDQQLSNAIYLLKEKHADPNFILDKYGISSMHCASGIANEDYGLKAVSVCLEHGGDPNVKSLDGTTPVMIAVLWGRAQILELLLKHGGNPYIKDHEGKSCFDFSFEDENSCIINILKSHSFPKEELYHNGHLFYTARYSASFEDPASSSLLNNARFLDDDLQILESIDSLDTLSMASCVNCHSFDESYSNYPCLKNDFSEIDTEENCVEIYMLHYKKPDSKYFTFDDINKRRTKSESEISNNDNQVAVLNNSNSELRMLGNDDGYKLDKNKNVKDLTSCFKSATIGMEIPKETENFKTAKCKSFVENSNYMEKNTSNSLDSSSQSSISSLSSCPTEYLKGEIKRHNLPFGPITKSTKHVYLRQLKKTKKGILSCNTHISGLNELMQSTFNHRLIEYVTKWKNFESDLIDDINSRVYFKRGGHEKCFFTYLLIDPFISNNLPKKQNILKTHQMWEIFVNSIFYVGKGKNSRPHSHLYEALKQKPGTKINKKVEKINEIWKNGHGVVCVNVFHNIISLEAHIREAAMIDALHGGNLTNQQAGEYHGCSKNWPLKKKRQFGICLLYSAMNVYLAEGERQIFANDLK